MKWCSGSEEEETEEGTEEGVGTGTPTCDWLPEVLPRVLLPLLQTALSLYPNGLQGEGFISMDEGVEEEGGGWGRRPVRVEGPANAASATVGDDELSFPSLPLCLELLLLLLRLPPPPPPPS